MNWQAKYQGQWLQVKDIRDIGYNLYTLYLNGEFYAEVHQDEIEDLEII